MTVWVFGDSYANHITHNNIHWPLKIANELDQNLINLALPGSSIDYTYEKFREVRNDINQNDIIILALTNIDRRWFYRDNPKSAFDRNNKEIKQYTLYIEHSEIYIIYLINFLYNINNLTRKLNLRTIILPCFYDVENLLKEQKTKFPFITVANGNLSNICKNEYSANIQHVLFSFSNDGKANHLIWKNHDVLAKLILENIQNQNTIDLSSPEFVTNAITKETLFDPIFMKENGLDIPQKAS